MEKEENTTLSRTNQKNYWLHPKNVGKRWLLGGCFYTGRFLLTTAQIAQNKTDNLTNFLRLLGTGWAAYKCWHNAYRCFSIKPPQQSISTKKSAWDTAHRLINIINGGLFIMSGVDYAVDAHSTILRLLGVAEVGLGVGICNYSYSTLNILTDKRSREKIAGFKVEACWALAWGEDAHAANERGITPLHVEINNKEDSWVIELLLDYGAPVNAADDDAKTPLHNVMEWDNHYLLLSRKIKIIELLLDGGANINAKNARGNTPLDVAIRLWFDKDGNRWGEGSVEAIQLLLDRSAANTLKQNEKNELLHKAVSIKHLNNIIPLLLDCGADINAINKLRETPLHCAVMNGNVNIVKLLANRGADINAIDQWCQTSLHCAIAADNNVDMVKLLANRGADINAVDTWHRTPLQIALVGEKYQAVALLALQGARLNPQEYTYVSNSFNKEAVQAYLNTEWDAYYKSACEQKYQQKDQ